MTIYYIFIIFITNNKNKNKKIMNKGLKITLLILSVIGLVSCVGADSCTKEKGVLCDSTKVVCDTSKVNLTKVDTMVVDSVVVDTIQ